MTTTNKKVITDAGKTAITDAALNLVDLTNELRGVRSLICVIANADASTFETFITDDTFFALQLSLQRLADSYAAETARIAEAVNDVEAAA